MSAETYLSVSWASSRANAEFELLCQVAVIGVGQEAVYGGPIVGVEGRATWLAGALPSGVALVRLTAAVFATPGSSDAIVAHAVSLECATAYW